MESSFLLFTQEMITFGLLLTMQLLLVLCVRSLARGYLGGINSYRLWLLPILWLPFYLIDLESYQWASVLSWLPLSSEGMSSEFFPILNQQIALSFDYILPELLPLSVQQKSPYYLWFGFALIWFAGAIILALKNIFVISSFYRRIKLLLKVVPESDRKKILVGTEGLIKTKIFYLEGISSPAILGLFKEKLILPLNFLTHFDSVQRAIILSHESVHVKRKDNIWNVIALSVRILFWINPLMYWAYRCYRSDQEVSCDAVALRNSNPEQGVTYAQMLLKTLGQPNGVVAPQVFSGWNNLLEIKERIKMIKQHVKNKNRAFSTRALLFSMILLGGTLTSCISSQGEEISSEMARLLNATEVAKAQQTSVSVMEVLITADNSSNADINETSKNELTPIYWEQVRYPVQALNSGVEGWVHVRFTVSDSGEVLNPEVVDHQPVSSNPFDDEALFTVSKFTFEPKVVNGEPVEVADVQYVFRFNLDN